jgi:G3E family GTPase
MPAALPVTVFTGFLGAGKTTLILALLKRLPPGYKVVVLKNEFGDVKVDSALAKNSNVEVAGYIIRRAQPYPYHSHT